MPMNWTIRPMATYQRRVIEDELDELLGSLPALSLEGPKGVGKTSTAERRGATTIKLDDPAVLEVVRAQPALLTTAPTPIVIDEWQRYPASWDYVRRAVDNDHSPGRFILTGSATPTQAPAHSGASRIVPIRMRPLALCERGVGTPTVSIATLLDGGRPGLDGTTDVDLEDYTNEILAGGFPAMRYGSPRAQRTALDGYIERIIDIDLPELGIEVRNPNTLRRWISAYSAATATVTSYEKIRVAAAGGDGAMPAKSTTIPYREAVERIWILDAVPAWAPTYNHLNRLVGTPKHHLADPALAARLVGLNAAALLHGEGPTVIPRDGTFLGALFESLATLSVRVFAQAGEARVFHMRDQSGRHEVDLIVVRGDQRIVAIEVKLSGTVGDADVKHLHWLRDKLGVDMLDAVVLTTGTTAYRRADGIGVVPLALLGP
jgi:predicted AAA+ superfamily ATPase